MRAGIALARNPRQFARLSLTATERLVQRQSQSWGTRSIQFLLKSFQTQFFDFAEDKVSRFRLFHTFLFLDDGRLHGATARQRLGELRFSPPILEHVASSGGRKKNRTIPRLVFARERETCLFEEVKISLKGTFWWLLAPLPGPTIPTASCR